MAGISSGLMRQTERKRGLPLFVSIDEKRAAVVRLWQTVVDRRVMGSFVQEDGVGDGDNGSNVKHEQRER